MSKMLIKDYCNKEIEVHLCCNDLPDHVTWSDVVALDAEFTGLNIHYDYLCLIQLRLKDDGPIYLIQVSDRTFKAPNICRLLVDKDVVKIGHNIFYDLMYLNRAFQVIAENVWCTYVASRLARSYALSHSLLDVCMDLLGVSLNKEERNTDWSVKNLTHKQQRYAANDVLYLHALKDKLSEKLERRQVWSVLNSCLKLIPHCAHIHALGLNDILSRYNR